MQILAGNINKPRLKRSYSDTDLAKIDISSITLPFKKINMNPIKQTVKQDLSPVESKMVNLSTSLINVDKLKAKDIQTPTQESLNQPKTIIHLDPNKPVKDYKEFSYYIAAQSQLFMRENILNFKIKEFLNNITGKYASVNLKRIPEINNDRKALLSFYRQAKDPMTRNCIWQTFDNLPEYIKVNDFLIPTRANHLILHVRALKGIEEYSQKKVKDARENIGEFLESIIPNLNKTDIETSKKLNNILTKIKGKEPINEEEAKLLKKYTASRKFKGILSNVLKNNLQKNETHKEILKLTKKFRPLALANDYIYYLSKNMLDDNEIKILDEIISDRQKFLNELFNKGKEDLLSDKYSLKEKKMINHQVKLYETLLDLEFPTDYPLGDSQDIKLLPNLNLSIEKQKDNDYIKIKNNFTGEVYDMKFTKAAYDFYIKPMNYRMQGYYGDCVFVSFCNGLIHSEEDFIKYCSLFRENEKGYLSIELKNGDIFNFNRNKTLLNNDLKKNIDQRGFLLLEQAIALSRMKSALNLMIEKDLFNSEEISKDELISIKKGLVNSMKTGNYDKISQRLDKIFEGLKKTDILKDKEIGKYKSLDSFQYTSLIHYLNSDRFKNSKDDKHKDYRKFLDIAFNPTQINMLTGISLNFMDNLGVGSNVGIPVIGTNNLKLTTHHAYNVLGVIGDSLYLQNTDRSIVEIPNWDFVKVKLNNLYSELSKIKNMKSEIESLNEDSKDLDKMKQYYSQRKDIMEKMVADFEDYVSFLMPKEYKKINKNLKDIKNQVKTYK